MKKNRRRARAESWEGFRIGGGKTGRIQGEVDSIRTSRLANEIIETPIIQPQNLGDAIKTTDEAMAAYSEKINIITTTIDAELAELEIRSHLRSKER